jgi:two-component system, NarL family, nitrate/nitrite response regulator NarL
MQSIWIFISSLYKLTLKCYRDALGEIIGSSCDPIVFISGVDEQALACASVEQVRMNDSIRILIVDDHTLFRESLVRLLESEPDLRVVAHCESIAAARDILGRTVVDMVLLDYDLGEESGAALLRELQQDADRIRVLVVTAGTSDAATADILKAGAAGVLYKHRDPAQLLEAIRKISKGELWLDSEVVRSLITSTKARGGPRRGPLSLSQQKVLSESSAASRTKRLLGNSRSRRPPSRP